MNYFVYLSLVFPSLEQFPLSYFNIFKYRISAFVNNRIHNIGPNQITIFITVLIKYNVTKGIFHREKNGHSDTNPLKTDFCLKKPAFSHEFMIDDARG